jgi:hypothetical protein
MTGNLVLRLAVDLAPSERGGRRRPLTDGYRASLSFGRRRGNDEPVVHDAVLVLEAAAELPPGGRGTARAWVLLPEQLPRSLAVGSVVTLLERDRIVGRARVIQLLVDPTPSPLNDIAAAKSRILSPHRA